MWSSLPRNTHRLFFSGDRRRCIEVVNDRSLLAESSWHSPAWLEALEAPEGRVLRATNPQQSLLVDRARIRHPRRVLVRRRIEATPAWVALSSDGAFVALSYWLSLQEQSIEAYEIRSWPDLELVAHVPERNAFYPPDARAPQPTSYDARRLADAGALAVSPDGRYLASTGNSLFKGCRGIHLIDVERASGLPKPRYPETTSLLEGSVMTNARLWSCRFDPDSDTIAALYASNLLLIDHGWFSGAMPALRDFDARVSCDDLWPRAWRTRTGEPVDAEPMSASLYQALRAELECPTVTCAPADRMVRLIESTHTPRLARRLWQRWMAYRLGRLSRRLEKSMNRLDSNGPRAKGPTARGERSPRTGHGE